MYLLLATDVKKSVMRNHSYMQKMNSAKK